MRLMVPGGLRPMTLKGQTKGRHGGYSTTLPTIIKTHLKAYPCLARRAIHITPRHTSLGHSVMRLMVPGGPHPMTARGQFKGRHAVSPTTHPTIKNPLPQKGIDACLIAQFGSSRITHLLMIV